MTAPPDEEPELRRSGDSFRGFSGDVAGTTGAGGNDGSSTGATGYGWLDCDSDPLPFEGLEWRKNLPFFRGDRLMPLLPCLAMLTARAAVFAVLNDSSSASPSSSPTLPSASPSASSFSVRGTEAADKRPAAPMLPPRLPTRDGTGVGSTKRISTLATGVSGTEGTEISGIGG